MFIMQSPCSGAYTFYPSGLTEKARVWAVSDMNGDGKGDFLLLDPDVYSWVPVLSSGSSWVQGTTRWLGNPGAIPL